jgi:glycosyltransferase involved in cell wall biosynthesis
MGIRIGIAGSRGIPNRYGGFERLAEQLSSGLAGSGHEVFVYNSHNHPYSGKIWNGVHIIHCYDPEYLIGSGGQFIYDLNCILDARTRKFDVLLILGYTSSSVWGRLLPRDSAVIFNMDGLEWQRTKYSKNVRRFLHYAEKLAVQYSDFHISDSPVIQTYYLNKYKLHTEYIAYGANPATEEDPHILRDYGVKPYKYFMLIARMEPENQIGAILNGYSLSNTDCHFLVIGNTGNAYGKRLVGKFGHDKRIHFTGALFDEKITHSLRRYAKLYFHGHSSGGTNPSLLEAMASCCPIIAHNNYFNRSVLGDDAFYFSCDSDIKLLIEQSQPGPLQEQMIGHNLEKIRVKYNWKTITDHYERFMLQCCYEHSRERDMAGKKWIYE